MKWEKFKIDFIRPKLFRSAQGLALGENYKIKNVERQTEIQ
jgi:hypothetical protein